MSGRDGSGAGRGFGRGRYAAGMRPVSESERISIADQIEAFQTSDAKEYSFQAGLSNNDRAVVHSECKKCGFTSKSHGKNETRRVTIYKSGRRKGGEQSTTHDLIFSRQSVGALTRYFKRNEPSDSELREATLEGMAAARNGGGDGAAAKGRAMPMNESHNQSNRGRRGNGKTSASMTASEVAVKHQAWEARQAQPETQALAAVRAALPIAPHRAAILEAVASQQVVLIAGETGCGKTTQVPQYILEDAWAKGAAVRVMCIQPRRISAVSVAERVAQERGERIGDSVGYNIRLESKGGPHSSLVFCTNGVLLRMLTQGDGLQGMTHIVVDEIHERDRFADFLLILLRDALPKHPHLRLVLMSATLHTELFSGYFGGCPIVRVPGFTYPVEDFYLEDALRLVNYSAGKGADSGVSNGSTQQRVRPQERAAVEAAMQDAFIAGTEEAWEQLLELTGAADQADGREGAPCINVQHRATGATPLMIAAGKGREEETMVLLSNGADPLLKANNGSTAADWATQFGHAELADMLKVAAEESARAEAMVKSASALSHYQANTNADEVDLVLIEQLLQYVCGVGQHARQDDASAGKGAVLVFLPGWDEIIRLKERLESTPQFSSRWYNVLPLHSMVPSADQRKVFVRPPVGVRKIVLATNMAETAITIDDIVCVINSGRLKEKSFDPYTSVSTLQAAWISKASEKQRRGRAGRCQAGVCFHLYSRSRSDALQPFQLPEIKRTALDEMCLQVKLLEPSGTPGSIAQFLGKAVEPPVAAAVDHAVSLLQDIGALEAGGEGLTLLGRHLAALPLPPRVGKLLLYGVLFRCLDPVLTVACAMAYRNPWVLPVDSAARRTASDVKLRLSEGAGGGSDHLALVRAFNSWSAARAQGGGADRAFCARNYLSAAAMNMLDGMRTQLLSELLSRRLITSLADSSVNANDAGLVRFVLGCGFYPLWGRLQDRLKGGEGRQAPKTNTVVTSKGEKVRIHASSVNTSAQEAEGDSCTVAIFEEVTRNDAFLYVTACTLLRPHFLPLVAAHLVVAEEPQDLMEDDEEEGGSNQEPQHPGVPTKVLIVDGCLRLRVDQHLLAELAVLRLRIAAAFAAKIDRPSELLSPAAEAALAVAAEVFSTESRSQGGQQPATLLAEQHVRDPRGSGGTRGRGGFMGGPARQEGNYGRGGRFALAPQPESGGRFYQARGQRDGFAGAGSNAAASRGGFRGSFRGSSSAGRDGGPGGRLSGTGGRGRGRVVVPGAMRTG